MKLYALLLAALLPGLAAAPDMVKGNAFGDPNAPILIEVFSDFQCPACKRFHDETLPQIMKDFVIPGKAYIVYRYFPLPQHAYGRKAAELVCACAQFDKYETAADVLFKNQEAWSQDGKLTETLATVLSPADVKKAASLVNVPAVQEPINHDLEEGRALPVPSTPTMAVTHKGRRDRLFGEGILKYTFVKAYFDEILKQ